MRVLLVNMPFSSLRWPAIGISLLKAGLARRGIACDIAYFNFLLAEMVGIDRYQWIDDAFGFVLGGERLFAKTFFGEQLPGDDQYASEVLLAADPDFGSGDRHDYESLARFIDPFVNSCFSKIRWPHYAIVGFSTTFQQTLASLALARMVKCAHPRICIVFGGANCEGDMGRELRRQFPFVDHVFSGDADDSFPLFVQQFARCGPSAPARRRARQVAHADAAGEHSERAHSSLVAKLDRLPRPDYDDYFQALAASPLADAIDPLLLFESSRGCWWGQKTPCAFCGLNGGTLAYRRKSPQRVLHELRALVDRYGVCQACATDNVMPAEYFDDLLPLLRDAGLGLRLEYELRPTLDRRQIESLVAAGLAAAQLGIETFSTPLLRRMRKGVTAVQNLQTLKWLSEARVDVKWNFLYAVPGERPEDYEPLAELLPGLTHLVPPQAAGPVRIDRYSPYFEQPERFGLPTLQPALAYRFVYPFPDAVLRQLAYYFVPAGQQLSRVPRYARPALNALAQWQASFPGAAFNQSDHLDGTLMLLDTRPAAARFQRRLRGLERTIYLFCDTARSLPAIVRHAATACSSGTNAADIKKLLDRWTAERLVANADGRYLSLAVRQPNSGESLGDGRDGATA